MSLAAPLWLLALIPLGLFAALLRPRAGAPRLAFALRAAAAVALVLALAQPQTGSDRGGPTLLLLDRSASIDAGMTARESAWVRTAIEQGACPAPCRVITFAGEPSFAGVPASGRLPASPAPGSGATDLAAALRLATGELRDGGRAIVLSDGLDTAPDPGGAIAAATRAARRAGVRVDTVALAPAATVADAAVTRLVAPSQLRAGDQLTLQATVRSTVARTATLRLSRDGAEIGRQPVRLRVGDNALLLTYRAPAEGWHAYRMAVAMSGDTVAANDALDATTRVGPAPRVLVLEGAPGSAGTLPQLLSDDGAAVTIASATPQALSQSDIEAADTVVLADVLARALAPARVTALQDAVRDGGIGLFVLGGEHSLSLGGYAGTTLDTLLPTQSLAPGGVRKRQLALQLVLDRSSSMNDLAGGYDSKIAMARAAARSALRLAARDDDEVGVVAFDADAHTIVPLERVNEQNVATIGRLLDGLDADGGTNMLRGLRSGVEQVEQSRARVKHLILLSDGVSEPGDYAPLLARMRRDGITLSTISLGRDADDALMRRLAQQAGGRFYDVGDARDLPRVFTRDARRSAPSVAVRATLPVTATAASPLVASLADERLPTLSGDVLTRLRAGATEALATEVNGARTPVLAQWQYGLGRVAVWTPGAGAWAGTWLDAEPAVFADAARWSARAVATPALQPALDPAARGRVIVDPLATAGRSLPLAQVDGTVRPPGGAQRGLDFVQVAPSRYAATLPGGSSASAGVYGIGVGADDAAALAAQALVAVPYPAEYRPQPADSAWLGALTSATGGSAHEPGDPDAALRPERAGGLWRLLAAAAIVLLLAAVAAGRRARPRDRVRARATSQ
ncbi:VWA domain-containing protein [Conexibacter sp. CPCC 206217]|uniref:VWA domain-containing protein n=1 Tax=Conexibacter sp. CPCC 206217 TaxID=3064574 RepID=UPI00271A72E8|nr:VWA domain-containing protein [Conexibacter sp. CPCC 206217]MDO8210593.1 VWA domain-containing protein [Conexibacter sp. CPCC 206217]